MLSHETLRQYMLHNFAMMQHHKYGLTELENMIPWEREIYILLLQNHVAEIDKRNAEAAK